MFRTARPWKGAGALALVGLLLSGSATRAESPPPLPRQLVGLGQQALDQGRPSEAVAFFRKALQLEPANAEARAALSDPSLKRLAFQDQPEAAPPAGDEAVPAPEPPADATAPAPVPPPPAPGMGSVTTAAPANATLEQGAELERVLSQRLQADIRGRIDQARDLLNHEQPQEALTGLRLALAAIDSDTQVPEAVRNALRREVRAQIQAATRRTEQIEASQAERLRLQAASTQRARDISSTLSDQDTVAAMMAQFDALMAQGYYNCLFNGGLGDITASTAPFYDARLLAQQARAIEQDALAPQVGILYAQYVGFLAQSFMFEEIKEYRYMMTLQDVERAAIPFPDTITIEYPNSEWFKKITETRYKRYESVDLAARDERTKAIERSLEKRIPMSFPNETELNDVIKYIKTQTDSAELPGGVPIYVDPIGLQEAEKTMSSPITIDLDGVPLKKTLKLALAQLDLIYTVKDGLLTITSKDSEVKELLTRVYPVADLALIPTSLMGGGGGGMGGGMGGMGGGMGGMGGGMGGMGGGMGGMGGGMGGGMMGGGMGGFQSLPLTQPGQDQPSSFTEKKSN